jgi:hypothetical protein
MQVLSALSEGVAVEALQHVSDVGTLCSCLKHCDGMRVALGSAHYSAPESVQNRAAEWRGADIWLRRRRVVEDPETDGFFVSQCPENINIITMSSIMDCLHVTGGTLSLGQEAVLVVDSSCSDVHLEGVTFTSMPL